MSLWSETTTVSGSDLTANLITADSGVSPCHIVFSLSAIKPVSLATRAAADPRA